jgi:hypothetical protein
MFEHCNPAPYRAQLAALGFAYGEPSLEPGPAECHWRELPGGALAVYTLYTHPGELPYGSLTLYRNRAAYVESGAGAWLASGESKPAELLGECRAECRAAGWLAVAVAQLAELCCTYYRTIYASAARMLGELGFTGFGGQTFECAQTLPGGAYLVAGAEHCESWAAGLYVSESAYEHGAEPVAYTPELGTPGELAQALAYRIGLGLPS